MYAYNSNYSIHEEPRDFVMRSELLHDVLTLVAVLSVIVFLWVQ